MTSSATQPATFWTLPNLKLPSLKFPWKFYRFAPPTFTFDPFYRFFALAAIHRYDKHAGPSHNRKFISFAITNRASIHERRITVFLCRALFFFSTPAVATQIIHEHRHIRTHPHNLTLSFTLSPTVISTLDLLAKKKKKKTKRRIGVCSYCLMTVASAEKKNGMSRKLIVLVDFVCFGKARSDK